MSTPAIHFLNRKGISFDIVKYEHNRKGAEYASESTGFPLEKIIKTLVVGLDSGDHVLALLPGDCELDLKLLAKICGVKKTGMADYSTAQRLTGYRVGGISPFGVRQEMNVYMEKRLVSYERVMINGGRRGLMIKMSPREIARFLGCRVVNMVKR